MSNLAARERHPRRGVKKKKEKRTKKKEKRGDNTWYCTTTASALAASILDPRRKGSPSHHKYHSLRPFKARLKPLIMVSHLLLNVKESEGSKIKRAYVFERRSYGRPKNDYLHQQYPPGEVETQGPTGATLGRRSRTRLRMCITTCRDLWSSTN